jgi:hypothetical protein
MLGRNKRIMVQKEAKKNTGTCVASAVLLSLLIVSLVCVIGSAPFTSGSPVASGSLSEKETDPNGYAASLAAKLKTSFFTTLPNGTMLMVYPIEYAGAYIDHSNNLHVVLSKYATNATIDNYRSIIGDSDVIFENAEFPLSYLYEAQHALTGVMVNFGIDVSSVNEITNRLELNLENSTKQSDIIEFLNNEITSFDDGCITFLGPNPITAGVEYIHPSTVPPVGNTGFLGTSCGVAAVAIAAVAIAMAFCIVLLRHGAKPHNSNGKSDGA